MSALPKRKKLRHKLKIKTNKQRPQNSNFLVILLALIVLVETIVILSFIAKKKPAESAKETKVETQRVVSRTSQIVPAISAVGKSSAKPRFIARKKGKIAIVIDDWGYNKKNLEVLKEINSPLTLAILPFQDYSRKVAEFANSHNYEVIVHMPMEPEAKESAALEPNTLMVYMSRSTIYSILDEAFINIRYAKGINNHMGSYATRNKSFMKTVSKKLKRNNLYFLDSYVTAESVAEGVVKEVGVKFAKRSVFLDNESDPQYIRGQLQQLATEAQNNGKAVGVGHNRANTLFTLKEEIPKLIRAGYEFVFVSEIVE
ncbi:divergent polysaccharide deacetylase family protein [Candidatus Omnitrophota bacterium]